MKDLVELGRYFIDIIEANNFQQYHTDVMDWIFDIDSLIKKKSKFIVKKEFNVINSFKRRFNHQKLTIISQINLISTCSSSLISWCGKNFLTVEINKKWQINKINLNDQNIIIWFGWYIWKEAILRKKKSTEISESNTQSWNSLFKKRVKKYQFNTSIYGYLVVFA